MSQERIMGTGGQKFEENLGIQKKLGQLRIVKSIHRSVLNINEMNIPGTVLSEPTDQPIESGAPLSSDSNNNTPLQARDFISRQQKRSFVPDPTNLVLTGSIKPQIVRDLDIARKNTITKSKGVETGS